MLICLYVSTCIMPFCLHSHGNCFFFINRLCTINCLEYFNPPLLLKPFFGKLNLLWTSQVQNKKSKLITGRRNSKIIKLAALKYFILVYSQNCCNAFLGPYYVILVNLNFKMPICWKL